MTAAGPLTTTFQAPSSCASAATEIYQVWSGDDDSSYVQGPLYTSDSDCFPSGYDPAPTNYYSPGWCPHGYTTACSSLASVSTQTETAVVCCPTQFSYTCLEPTPASERETQQPSLGCTTTWAAAEQAVFGVTVVSDGKVGSSTVVSENGGGITAYGIQVRFQSGDPTPTPTSDDAGIPVITRTSSPSISVPTQPSETGSASGGVSTPAAIGIGIGSAVVALLAAGLIGLFFFLRRRRKRRSSSFAPPEPPPVPPKELSGPPIPYRAVPPPYELSEDASPRHPSIYGSKRHMSASPASATALLRSMQRAESGVLGHRPAELEADVPSEADGLSEASLRDRASPAISDNSGWTDRQARGGTMPTPWI